ncbi:hypothetical protein CWB99_15960 [Pseudoalteromonas rubra]|uniref:Uncharacterized protein n=1 Tax=Pseudoalteromonas rubra TaxID=43658 RepID=A0A5S3WKJ0_9GAMM|nr:hypothetical protein CWB99_15960 [Pseudoalteromonas rubra]TMP29507.1 hypothetical protein CWC00_19055 [Pseudoalteromonas rubra]
MHFVAVRHIPPTQPINVGLLQINIDPYASRLLILDRHTNKLIAALKPNGARVRRFMPAQYTIDPKLMVIMLDDTKVYNAAIVDHVQAQIVDLVTLDSSALI